MRCIVYDNLRAYIFQTRNCIRIRKIRLQNMNPFIRILTAVLLNIDAENFCLRELLLPHPKACALENAKFQQPQRA